MAALAGRRLRGRALVLAYHNVLPEGEAPLGEASLHLPERTFIAQLDLLRDVCDVVPLAGILDPVAPDARPRVAITFDDAYAGAVRVGLAAVRRRGLPVTMFVAPGLLEGRAFWWDVLAMPRGELREQVRRHALYACRGEDEAVRRWARETGLPLGEPPEALRGATEAELRGAADEGALTIGVHTWSHPNLAALEAAELRAELARPLAWLRARFAGVVPWLAYPYGLAPADGGRAARSAGLDVGLLVSGGWLPPAGVDPYAVPRFNVPAGISLDGFRLRLAGLLPR